ncbi:MAG TPA: hypothetical protein VEL47_06835 [Myxococcota bacterium]|nr:hypothetical protein [Myxococcota bacterium]
MTQYYLTSLLRLRERSKIAAETELREAIQSHRLAEIKLVEIARSLRDSVSARTKLQQSFFLRARQYSCNKREVSCHISSRERHLSSENHLKTTLAEQQETVDRALLKIELAKTRAIDAERDLKLIERHRAKWDQQRKRQKDIQEEYINDDLNGVRFAIKKV